MKKRIAVSISALLLLLSMAASAQRPARNVSGRRHPNLAAAQRLSRQAWEKIMAAQKANEWDMQGHAQKAKGAAGSGQRGAQGSGGSGQRGQEVTRLRDESTGRRSNASRPPTKRRSP